MIKPHQIFKVLLILLLLVSSQAMSFSTTENKVLAATIPTGTYSISGIMLIDIGSEQVK